MARGWMSGVFEHGGVEEEEGCGGGGAEWGFGGIVNGHYRSLSELN